MWSPWPSGGRSSPARRAGWPLCPCIGTPPARAGRRDIEPAPPLPFQPLRGRNLGQLRPQDRHDRLAPVVPQRRAEGVLDPAAAAPRCPAGLDHPLPARGGVGDALGQQRLALALAGHTARFAVVARGRVEQARILAQPRDHRHSGTQPVQQSSRAANSPSMTATMGRPCSQRWSASSIRRAHSVTVRWRRPCRSDQALLG